MATILDAQRPPFGAWLGKQTHRAGWIQDLIHIARDDPQFPKHENPDGVRAYLRTYRINPGLMHAVDDAEIEWMIYEGARH